MARITDITQSASAGCSTLTAGIKTLWLVDNLDITSFTCTEVATKAEWTAVTLSGANKLFKWTFTNDNTAFYNQTQANVTENVEQSILINLNGIDAEKLDNLNGLKATCGLTAFIELTSGTILCCGRDYDYTANTNAEMAKPLQLKGQVLSGLGNGDSEKVVVELVGASKIFQFTTTLSAAALTAL